jgi:dynein heavy chain
MFQNVHLMQTWMKDFERNFEIVLEEGAHPEFRCFISSEPPGLPHMEIIPESILQISLKVANEAPTDLKSNIRRAYSKFDESHFEKAKSHKPNEFKALLFGLCMFHSLILGRRKFGSQGWSRKYNFNDGDLKICGDILHNYLSNYEQVPYADLQYLYGEIMYGGHITDNWDRRTNSTYLKVLIRPQILNGMNMTLAPGFRSPDPAKFDRNAYIRYVEEKLPVEIPQMFGLHPNAEIGYLTNLGETLFTTILQCSGGSGGGGGSKKDATVKLLIDKFLTDLPPEFVMLELFERAKDRTPFVVVCLQECERMNILTSTIKKSLEELKKGLDGQLNMTDEMESLGDKLFINAQPPTWVAVAYFSNKDLMSWFEDLLLRIAQLQEYSDEMVAPKSLWISGLFNPMSFLTAIMQITARTDGLALDDMMLKTDVTNTRDPKEIVETASKGAYVHGFFLEGAGWELGRGTEQGYLTDMILKELHPVLPVVHVTAIDRKNLVVEGFYLCPAYVTTSRGPTFVFQTYLKMESEETDPNTWILAGVALVLAPLFAQLFLS